MSNKDKKSWWQKLSEKDKRTTYDETFNSQFYVEKPTKWELGQLFKKKKEKDGNNNVQG